MLGGYIDRIVCKAGISLKLSNNCTIKKKVGQTRIPEQCVSHEMIESRHNVLPLFRLVFLVVIYYVGDGECRHLTTRYQC